mmetsp:Transcript_17644/g.36887  ORF Transcript_17644/g.36887 Transcript_17644/m.36887 type:complete len:213 (+) Transcript_17644:1190-1828(+)
MFIQSIITTTLPSFSSNIILFIVHGNNIIVNIPARNQIPLHIPLRLPNLLLCRVIFISVRRIHDLLKLVRVVFSLHELEYHFFLCRAQRCPRCKGMLLLPLSGIILIILLKCTARCSSSLLPTIIIVPQNTPDLFHPTLQLLPPRILQPLQLLLLRLPFCRLAFLPRPAFLFSGFVLATQYLIGRVGLGTGVVTGVVVRTRVVNNATGGTRG